MNVFTVLMSDPVKEDRYDKPIIGNDNMLDVIKSPITKRQIKLKVYSILLKYQQVEQDVDLHNSLEGLLYMYYISNGNLSKFSSMEFNESNIKKLNKCKIKYGNLNYFGK